MFEALIDIIDNTTQAVESFYTDVVHQIEESEPAKAYREAKEQAYKQSKEYEIKEGIIYLKKQIEDRKKALKTMDEAEEIFHINTKTEETYDDLDIKLPISPRYGEFERALEGHELNNTELEIAHHAIKDTRVKVPQEIKALKALINIKENNLKAEITSEATVTAALHTVAIVGTVALAPVVGTTATVIGVAVCLPFAYNDFKETFNKLREVYNA